MTMTEADQAYHAQYARTIITVAICEARKEILTDGTTHEEALSIADLMNNKITSLTLTK